MYLNNGNKGNSDKYETDDYDRDDGETETIVVTVRIHEDTSSFSRSTRSRPSEKQRSSQPTENRSQLRSYIRPSSFNNTNSTPFCPPFGDGMHFNPSSFNTARPEPPSSYGTVCRYNAATAATNYADGQNNIQYAITDARCTSTTVTDARTPMPIVARRPALTATRRHPVLTPRLMYPTPPALTYPVAAPITPTLDVSTSNNQPNDANMWIARRA